jgi:DNA replication protein DnaC
MTAREIDVHTLPAMLTALRLPSFGKRWQAFAEQADHEGWPAARFLAALAECEIAERETRRIQRHLNESRLPAGKTLATFDFAVLPSVPRRRIEALAAGDWLETGANLIAIGNSGAGKTHLLCAIGHALIEAGWRVLYTRTTDLVQKLQAARRDLALESALAKLDKYDLLVLDACRSVRACPDETAQWAVSSEARPGGLAYAQKDQAETSVLFELVARRYETRSLAIAANQPFSAWDRVFPDRAVTVAAIDRLVHHATILEMNVDSYRRRAAVDRRQNEAVAQPLTSAESLADNQKGA